MDPVKQKGIAEELDRLPDYVNAEVNADADTVADVDINLCHPGL